MLKAMIREGYFYNIPKILEEAQMCITNNVPFVCISEKIAETSFAEKMDISFVTNSYICYH